MDSVSMEPSRIQAITDVDIEAPLGIDDKLRWFYGEVLGLAEVPVEQLPGDTG